MNYISDKLLEDAHDYVFELLNKRLSENLIYHSPNHTKEVLKNAAEIGEYSKLDKNNLNLLKISALFHDVGFIDIYDGHEEKSVAYVKEFLGRYSIDDETVQRIARIIMATKVPQHPLDFISRILCDADLMNMSNEKDYLKDVELLRKEWINCGKENYSKKEFYQVSLDFFKTHHFHTEYGKTILQPRKEVTEKILQRCLSG